MKKRKVIYTCITSNYDVLEDHRFINPNCDYICFSNTITPNSKNRSWEIRPLKHKAADPQRTQRWHKIFAYKLLPEYNESLYVDGNIEFLNESVFRDVDRMKESDTVFASAPHPSRDCIYDEAEACITLKKDKKNIINKQINLIKKDKFPAHYGMFENGIMYRQHNNDELKKIMREWWWWIENYSVRDQLSLTYVLWKNNFNCKKLTNHTYRDKIRSVHFWPHNLDAREHIRHLDMHIGRLVLHLDKANQHIFQQSINIAELHQDIRNIKDSKAYRQAITLRKLRHPSKEISKQ